MKKILKITAIAIAVVVAVLIVAAFLTEPKWQVERATSITAPAESIRPYLSRLTSWPQWTVWNTDNYPKMKIEHHGPADGVGAIQRWTDGGDSGQIELTQADPSQVGYRVVMNEGEYVMDGTISLASAGPTTSIVWRVSGDAGNNPVHRAFLIVLKPFMAKQIEDNLARLKEKLEQNGRV